MSITITSQPLHLILGYNPIVYKATSTNYAVQYFKYNIKVYVNADIGHQNGTLVGTFRFLPLQDGSFRMDISEVVKSYLTYNFVYDLSAVTSCYSGMQSRIYVVISEDINGTLTNAVTSSGAVVAVNGGLDVDKWLDANTNFYYKYRPDHVTPTNSYWLSHDNLVNESFVNEYQVGYAEQRNLDYPSNANYNPKYLKYNIYNGSGLRLSFTLSPATTTVENYMSFPVGMANIKHSGLTWASSDTHYTIQAFNFSNNACGNLYQFNIVSCKQEFPWICLYFKRKNGSMTPLYFKLNNKKTINTEKGTYDKYLNYNYTKYDRGLDLYKNKSYYTWELMSDWFTNGEINLYDELIQSSTVFMFTYYDFINVPTTIPVIVITPDAQLRNEILDGITQYPITVRSSNYNINN